MHAIVPPSVVSIQLREAAQAKHFDNPLSKITVPPGVYEGTLQTSDNGVGWVVIQRNGRACGWSYPALSVLLEDDVVRVFRAGTPVDSVDEL